MIGYDPLHIFDISSSKDKDQSQDGLKNIKTTSKGFWTFQNYFYVKANNFSFTFNHLKSVLKLFWPLGFILLFLSFLSLFASEKKGREKQGRQNVENAFVCWYCSTEEKIPTFNSPRKRRERKKCVCTHLSQKLHFVCTAVWGWKIS